MRALLPCLCLLGFLSVGCGDANPPTKHAGPRLPEGEYAANERLVVAGQPSETRLAELASGFDLVFDINPASKAPAFDEAAAVKAAGLEYVRVPLSKTTVFEKAEREKAYALLDRIESENLRAYLHCSTANRAGALWAFYLVERKGRSPQEALAEGKRVGLTKLEPAVKQALGLE